MSSTSVDQPAEQEFDVFERPVGESGVGWSPREAWAQVWSGAGRATVSEVIHSRGLRRWVFGAGIWLIYVVAEIPNLLDEPLGEAVLSAVILLLFSLIYLFAVPFAFAGFRIVAWLAPLTMLVLLLVYLPFGGSGALGLGVYAGVAFAVCWPRPWGLVAVGVLAVAVAVLPQYVGAWDVSGIDWNPAVPLVLGPLVAYAFVGLNRRNYELRDARSDIARMAAEQERSRIARDMHDILGHTLTTVTVKSSLASRLVERDPERAAAEMREVELLARQGLADVRAVIAGYREVSVGAELATAREVLRAAGIEAELPPSAEEVRPQFNELFGWVVREGVTNVVRHSGATHCRITLTAGAVEVVDDGVGGRKADPDATGSDGSGLRGLGERVRAAGATMTHGPTASGGYRLRVEAC